MLWSVRDIDRDQTLPIVRDIGGDIGILRRQLSTSGATDRGYHERREEDSKRIRTHSLGEKLHRNLKLYRKIVGIT